jgi:hypothetical protein
MRVQAKPGVHVDDEREHQHLRALHEYLVVGLDDESLRVINDVGEPVLYPKFLFHVVEASVPADWVRQDYDDGEWHIDPPECAQPGFYEAWFDGDPDARRVFDGVVARLLGSEACAPS